MNSTFFWSRIQWHGQVLMGSCFSFLGLNLPLLSPAKERDSSTSFKTRSQEYCCHSHPKQSRFSHLRRNRRKMETLRLHFTKESRESHNPQVVAQSLSRVQLFETPWTAACWASLSFTISLTLLRLKSIESVMPPTHLNFCHHSIQSLLFSLLKGKKCCKD